VIAVDRVPCAALLAARGALDALCGEGFETATLRLAVEQYEREGDRLLLARAFIGALQASGVDPDELDGIELLTDVEDRSGEMPVPKEAMIDRRGEGFYDLGVLVLALPRCARRVIVAKFLATHADHPSLAEAVAHLFMTALDEPTRGVLRFWLANHGGKAGRWLLAREEGEAGLPHADTPDVAMLAASWAKPGKLADTVNLFQEPFFASWYYEDTGRSQTTGYFEAAAKSLVSGTCPVVITKDVERALDGLASLWLPAFFDEEARAA
jgi:hypothetical protein